MLYYVKARSNIGEECTQDKKDDYRNFKKLINVDFIFFWNKVH